MKSNNNFDSKILDDDIDKLSKNLYLESPDLWIDFTDKINDNTFDEMVLFFASKYNFLSIIKHAINNNLININLPSKNNTYSTVIQHLMSVAIQNNNLEIYDYFKGLLSEKHDFPSKTPDLDTKNIELNSQNAESKNTVVHNNENNYTKKYSPKFICSICSANVFESGFSVLENIVYKYSQEENSSKEISREHLSQVTCCNCNNIVKDVTPKKLESLCIIQNCSKCSTDLTVCGITDKAKMTFNEKTNKFSPTSTSYHCSNCDNLISEDQQKFFGL